jgi:hypothetical protein
MKQGKFYRNRMKKNENYVKICILNVPKNASSGLAFQSSDAKILKQLKKNFKNQSLQRV